MKKQLLLVTAMLLISWGAMAQFAGGDGTSGNPYQITTAEQMDNVRSFRTNHFILTSDIDLVDYANWVPICNSSTKFTGSFDGGGFTINNLTIDRPSDSYVGLFGYFQPAVAADFIKNISLTNVNINGGNTIGSVVGECYNGTIHNCNMQGQLSGSNTIGGIVGKAIVAATISNCYSDVTINALHGSCGGIVGSVWYGGSIIKECFSKGSIYSSNQSNGGIVGNFGMDGLGSVENCYSTTNIISDINGNYNGGIAGEISNGDKIIKNSFSTGIVEAGSSVGGISGYVYNATVKNCFSANTRVNVLSPNQWAYLGRISSNDYSSTYTNNYAWEDIYVKNEKITDGTLTNINGANITLSQIQTEAFFTNIENWADEAWDFGSTWAINLSISPYPILQAVPSAFQKMQHSQGIFWTVPFAFGKNATIENVANGGVNEITFESSNPAVIEVVGNTLVTHMAGTADITATIAESEFYAENSITQTFTVYESGSGTKEDPFLISTIDELNSIRNNVSLHYKLANDIDLASIPNWEPIGQSYPSYFTGSFDGNNHTISNLTISQPSNSLVAFFGRFEPSIPGDSIKNLTLSNVNIAGNSQSASIVAEVVKGHIHNCHSSGSITSLNKAGGIVGQLSFYGAGKSKEIGLGITNCTSSCNVATQFENAGGIVGRIEGEYNTKLSQYENAVITNCSSSGTISGLNNVAGIAGYASSCEITQCYSTGNAIGIDKTGGIVGGGKDNLLINQCFSNGVISTNEDNVGGIIGFYNKGDITSVAIISNSYSTGTVKSDTQLRAGGICGYASSPLTISNCYSTGLVRSTNLSGGIAGDMSSSTIKNSVAINAKVISKGGAGRLICDNDGASTFINNYGWDGLYVNDEIETGGNLTNEYGLDATIALLTSQEFYTTTANWDTEAWDFIDTWVLNPEVSPYPVLKELNLAAQAIKHAQVITWTQQLSGNISDEILLTAAGGVNAITYSTSNSEVASINENTLHIHSSGLANITATAPESEFYSLSSMTKRILIYDGGDGTVENPYLISTKEQLDDVRNNLSAHYRVIADIDLSSIENWNPIGNYDLPFAGSFDGNGFTISNLKAHYPYDDYTGLFGCFIPNTEGDSIKNITLDNASIIGNEYNGAVAGYVIFGSIYNCHSSGKITSNDDIAGGIVGYMETTSDISFCSSSCQVQALVSGYAGGIAGYINNSILANCYSIGNISGSNSIGGIVGYATNNSTITSCYNNGNIVGFNQVGGLIGYSSGSTTSKCFSAGEIKANNTAGGIIGYAENNSSINQCYSTGFVSVTNEYVGGICGFIENTTISETYATGKVYGDGYNGGLIGYSDGSVINNSFSANAHIGEYGELGRIVSEYNFSTSTNNNNYAWDNMYVGEATITDGSLTNTNGLNASFENLSTESFFTTSGNWDSSPWDFTETWVMNPAVSPYPILQAFAAEPQQVKHAQAITWPQDIATTVGNSLTLTAVGGRTGSTIVYSSSQPDVASIVGNEMTVNTAGGSHIMAYVEGNDFFAADSVKKVLINFESEGTELDPYLIYNLAELDAVRFNLSAYYKLMVDIDMSPIANWEPIGDDSYYFGGNFDGNSHELSNLNINLPLRMFVGLFGYIEGGEVKNLTINNVNICGSENVGAIAGIVYESSLIDNCSSSGVISGANYYAGGIAGYIQTSGVINSSSSCSILNFQEYSGGIVGYMNDANVENCYFSGTINNTGYTSGGICGYIRESTIQSSFNIGSIYGMDEVAGISASVHDNSTIHNCYNTGSIVASAYNAGGITGNLRYNSQVNNCYNTGSVVGNISNVGGITSGANSSNITNCVSISAVVFGSNPADYNVYNRIYGYDDAYNTLSNNYAWTDMYVNGSKATNGALDNENGQNADLASLKSEAFYTNPENWDTEAWDFTNIWEMNPSISPYPILKNIPSDGQKVQHAQVMTDAWAQTLPSEATLYENITLTAPSEGPSELLLYTSGNNEVALVSENSAMPVGFGTTTISVMYPETEFYAASNSISKTITVTNKATLTIGGSFTALNKEFDGNVSATIENNNLSLVGIFGDQDVSLTNIIIEFASADIANNIVVSIVSAELGGADKDSYTLSLDGAPTALANITELVGVETGFANDIRVYPNPFTNTINIANAENVQRIVISNIIGKVVMEIDLNQSPTHTLTTNLHSGVYLVTIVANDGNRVVRKMVRK